MAESRSDEVVASFHCLENLSVGDKRKFNLFSRGPTINTPSNIIHHAFEAVVNRCPDAVAVYHHAGTSISYAELDKRANILANELRNTYGVQREDRVLLVFSRCIEMVVFILAVLKAGGQYVPVDGSVTPEEILKHMIFDSGSTVILCLPKFLSKVKECLPAHLADKTRILALDSESSIWMTGDRTRPSTESAPTDGAYVIYTSGSTGTPKGVDVLHGGVTNSLLLEPGKLGITVGKNVIQQLNVAFDLGAWEILATVMNGGTLHIRGSGNDAWQECLRRVDTAIATPSVALKHFPRPADFPNMKTIAVGGEPCPKTLAENWAPHVDFYNICGPTEITILNSSHKHLPGSTLSIGKPIPNSNIYILDENENPVKIGDIGSMWASGPGVSRQYLNLPDLTASRYKPDKFARNGRNMFSTGDLARWMEDGSLETLGRADDQVKISGFRVELDGVSRSIEQCPTVVKACALKIDDSLWGFYSAPQALSDDLLKATLGPQLPFYAIPKIWKHLPEIELTRNGKVDKVKLKAIANAEKVLLSASEKEMVVSFPEAVHVSDTKSEARKSYDTEKITVREVSSSISSNSDNSSSKSSIKQVYTLPPKSGIHGWRWLRHTAMNAYRKLFGLIFIANTIPFVFMLWKARNNSFSLPIPNLVTAVASNLLGAVLLRQDNVVNMIYWLATRIPVSAPLFVRRHIARVYHLGGVHSGCAVSASIWWLIFAIEASRCYFIPTPTNIYRISDATIVLTYLVLACLTIILIMAYPTIRMKMHDQFEWTHRFAGWTTLLLVWIHLLVATSSLQPTSQQSLGKSLFVSPNVYLILLTTFSIASPWLSLKKVAVVAEPLSRHAVRLHFTHFTPRMSSSAAPRITDRPLVEWHSFAAIFAPGKKGFSLIVSRAGDWTGKIIDNPPTSLWTRGTPASGVLAIAPLFKKIILVATGSGIGPCMPVILEKRVPCRVLWSAKNPLKTYGEEIMNDVLAMDPDAVVWDTAIKGRPDMAALAYQMYMESGAECVCVISNKSVTSKLVYALESRGVPAFGPVFDS